MSLNTLPPLSRTSVFTDLRRSFAFSLPKSRSSAATVIFFFVMCIAVTVLQKFALDLDLSPFGFAVSIGGLEAALPIFYLSMVVLTFFVSLKVSINRLLLFSLFTLTVLVSVSLQHGSYSMNSLLLAFAIYTPFVFQIDVREQTYRQMISCFLNVMLVMGLVAIGQHIVQLIWSYRVWPDLDHILPLQFQMQNFNYIQPLKYGSRFMKPNAIFFVEVSVLSQWLAVALALELVFFARIWRMAFYASVLMACFAGTGLLLIAIAGPVLLGRVNARLMGLIFLAVLVALVVAVKIHWYDIVSHRFLEYQKVGASANQRFVAPVDVMFAEFDKPGFFFTGEGPGAISKTEGNTWWVVAKLAYEYGVLPTFAFCSFLLYVLFAGAPSKRMAFTYAILMNFMGGFIIPIWPLLIFVLGGLFRIKASERGSDRGKGKGSGRSKKKSRGLTAPGSRGLTEKDMAGLFQPKPRPTAPTA